MGFDRAQRPRTAARARAARAGFTPFLAFGGDVSTRSIRRRRPIGCAGGSENSGIGMRLGIGPGLAPPSCAASCRARSSGELIPSSRSALRLWRTHLAAAGSSTSVVPCEFVMKNEPMKPRSAMMPATKKATFAPWIGPAAP